MNLNAFSSYVRAQSDLQALVELRVLHQVQKNQTCPTSNQGENVCNHDRTNSAVCICERRVLSSTDIRAVSAPCRLRLNVTPALHESLGCQESGYLGITATRPARGEARHLFFCLHILGVCGTPPAIRPIRF